jgi:hypothetical protein
MEERLFYIKNCMFPRSYLEHTLINIFRRGRGRLEEKGYRVK